MITPGKFMALNMVLMVVAIYIAAAVIGEGNRALGWVGIGAICYFWTSLVLYTNWFLWDAPLEKASEADLRAILHEWTWEGPYGRNKNHWSRVMASSDREKKSRAYERLAAIHEGLLRFQPENKQLQDDLARYRRG